jgi:hypothetical protein
MDDQYSVVMLLHIAKWQATVDEVAIPPRITLGRFAHSRFEKLYQHLCTEQGLDEGDPLQHGAYALIEPVPSQGLSKTRSGPPRAARAAGVPGAVGWAGDWQSGQR